MSRIRVKRLSDLKSVLSKDKVQVIIAGELYRRAVGTGGQEGNRPLGFGSSVNPYTTRGKGPIMPITLQLKSVSSKNKVQVLIAGDMF